MIHQNSTGNRRNKHQHYTADSEANQVHYVNHHLFRPDDPSFNDQYNDGVGGGGGGETAARGEGGILRQEKVPKTKKTKNAKFSVLPR